MRILFAGGGTAGHINPALAVARHVKEQDAKNEILFVGKRGNMEATLVPKEGYEIEFIDIEGFKRSLSPRNILVVYKMFKAVGSCKKIIKRFKPDVVISTGGYVGGPIMVAASKLGVPSLIHEQNVYPGVAVNMSSKHANYIATSFEQTAQYTKYPDKCEFTGNPVRSGLLGADYVKARQSMGLGDKPMVLVVGGSLGADRINSAMIAYIKRLSGNSNIQILFATGTRNYDAVIAKMKEAGINPDSGADIKIVPYIYNMDEAMAAADIVISRGGAITLSEITALGKASILIPSPNTTRNQQVENVNLLKGKGAAKVIYESELTPEHLQDTVESMLADAAGMKQIRQNAKAMGVTDAVEKIFALAAGLAKK